MVRITPPPPMPLRATRRAVEEADLQVRREAAEQGEPVFQHAARADHEGTCGRLPFGKQAQQTHDLVGLAEPHVVGQRAPDPNQVSAPQPGDARGLVGAELGPQAGRIQDFLPARPCRTAANSRNSSSGPSTGRPVSATSRMNATRLPRTPRSRLRFGIRKPSSSKRLHVRRANDGFADSRETGIDEIERLGPGHFVRPQ